MALIFGLLLSLNVLTFPLISEGNQVVVQSQEISYIDLDNYDNLPLTVEEEEKETGEKPVRPRVTMVAVSSLYLEGLMERYGEDYGVSKEVLKKIAFCESTYNPMAINGPYAGMYQFLASTWISNRNAMGLDSNPDLRFNAEEAIKTTAFKISRDGTGAWPVCGK